MEVRCGVNTASRPGAAAECYRRETERDFLQFPPETHCPYESLEAGLPSLRPSLPLLFHSPLQFFVQPPLRRSYCENCISLQPARNGSKCLMQCCLSVFFSLPPYLSLSSVYQFDMYTPPPLPPSLSSAAFSSSLKGHCLTFIQTYFVFEHCKNKQTKYVRHMSIYTFRTTSDPLVLCWGFRFYRQVLMHFPLKESRCRIIFLRRH